MTQCKYDITVQQGANWSLILNWQDDEGEPINLTGYSAKMQIRPYYDSMTIVATLSTVSGGITIDPLIGKVTASLTAIQTSAITVLEGVYDMELTSPSGVVTRIIGGAYTLSQEVTR